MLGLRAALALGLRLALAPTLPAHKPVDRSMVVGGSFEKSAPASRAPPPAACSARRRAAPAPRAALPWRRARPPAPRFAHPPVLRHGCMASPSGAQMESRFL